MITRAFFPIGLFCLAGLCSAPIMAEQLTNIDVPVNMVVPSNACTGQAIAFQGDSHTLINVSVNNNSVHFQSHLNVQGVAGVGLTDGAKYILADGSTFNINVNGAPPVEVQTNLDFSLIGRAQAPDMRLRLLFHTTVDAQGNVTADFVKASIVCQQ